MKITGGVPSRFVSESSATGSGPRGKLPFLSGTTIGQQIAMVMIGFDPSQDHFNSFSGGNKQSFFSLYEVG